MNLTSLLQTKSLDQIQQDVDATDVKLRRALGPIQLTLLGIGAIIGAGIFATVGTAAAGDAVRLGAGPALMASFLITAVVCGFAALCYAEFAAMVPISGSAYTYSYATLGELVAWIIGWDLIIEYAVGNIAVAISWANYFKTFVQGFGVHIPDWLSMDYRTAAKIIDQAGVQTVFRDAPHIFGVPIVFNLLAASIVTLITIVLVWGIRESVRFNAVMVIIKIIVLTFFIIVGFYWVKPENWVPFAPNGWAGISTGAAIVFFAYIGFDAVSTAAEETENPQRNLPIGIIASLLICTVFYIVVSAVFTGLVPFDVLKTKLATEQAEPLTMALQYADPGLGWAVGLVAFGSVIAHTAVLLVFQLGQPRIFFSMARDGLLPPAFARVHRRFRTPHIATILTGVFVGGFAAIASLDEMVDLTNIGTLFAFILVCAGLIVLRRREPERPRPFRVPGGWRWTVVLYAGLVIAVVLSPMGITSKALLLAAAAIAFALARNHIMPFLGILSCLYLIYYLPPTSWLRFAAWLNFGLVIYASYGSVKSRLTGRELAAAAGRHDSQTALNGAWLALGGTTLLFFMHGCDLYIAASAHSAAPGGWQALANPAAWFAWTWFMALPLALNGAVLSPVLIRRARRAARVDNSSENLRMAGRAQRLAGVVATIIVLYFIMTAVI